MPADLQKVRELFLHAVGKLPPEQWDEYVGEACGGDAELAQQVGRLLQVHREAGSFLDRPAAAVGATGVFTPSPGEEVSAVQLRERPGTVIGPYKLLQQIGEGGMGVVWMAEQTQPVQRKVALKVIKPGMDSRQVIARFEAERQALAMMDHVNIARVFDGGATEAGRPYFVMELVHGVPITKYCDDYHLTPRERLELFVPVCQAIQHAHQKGIIHRDVKPSNVMITLYDGKAVPKVIDFGVAKATEQKLTERTLFTQYGTMIGTLEYMSPEQAEMSALGVDTRSDIYSLGVLLYELLTGSTPLTHERMKEAAYAEILRMIKEEEPPKPSTRLSDSGEALASISAQRKTEPAKLSKLMRGELDWIVMKTLEKDRNRRYETANGFAADVQRYLNDETVQACPPSAVYRLRKFVRRNKTALAVAGLILFCVAVLGGGVTWAVRDQAARQWEAEGKALEALEAAEPCLRAGHPRDRVLVSAAQRVEAQLDSSLLGPQLRRRAQQLLRDVRMLTDLDDIRLRQAESKQGVMFDASGTEARYAAAFSEYGLDVMALGRAEASARIRNSAIHETLLTGLDSWMQVKPTQHKDRNGLRAVADGADDSAWRRAFREAALALDAQKLKALAGQPEAPAQPPSVLAWLGLVLEAAGLSNDAGTILRQAQQRYPGDFWINYNLGHVLVFGPSAHGPEEAVGYFRAAVAIRPSSAEASSILGLALFATGDVNRAIAAYRQAIALDPVYAIAHENLGDALRRQGKLDDAIACFRKACQLAPEFAAAHAALGDCYAQLGRWDEAAAEFDRSLEVDPTDYDRWCSKAALHADLGDLDGYRRTCGKMLARFGETDQTLDRVARACLLLPDALGTADADRVQKLALRLVTDTEKDQFLYYWFVLAKGLADYRAGRYAEAVRWLERFPPNADGVHWDAIKFAVLAMARHGLGRDDEARADLAKAERIIAKTPDLNWRDWVHARVLYREAEVLFKKKSGDRNQVSDKMQP